MSFRNLEIPYFSQRENKCIWIEKYPLDSKIIDADGKHLAGGIVPNGKTYYLEYSSFNIPEDDSKKSVGKVAVLAIFREIITRILKVLVAMALVGLLLPFTSKIFF